MSIEFTRNKHWQSGGTDIDGVGFSDGYRWLLAVDLFGIQFIVGRSAYVSPWPHRRLWCWLHGHDKQDNNLTNPARRYYCPNCGTLWPGEIP